MAAGTPFYLPDVNFLYPCLAMEVPEQRLDRNVRYLLKPNRFNGIYKPIKEVLQPHGQPNRQFEGRSGAGAGAGTLPLLDRSAPWGALSSPPSSWAGGALAARTLRSTPQNGWAGFAKWPGDAFPSLLPL